MKLLREGRTNPKMARMERELGIRSWNLSLAASTASGFNVCPRSTPACEAICLMVQGRGKTSSVQKARIGQTVDLFQNRARFLADLSDDLDTVYRLVSKAGRRPVVRLNTFSDIRWERRLPLDRWSDIQFYDYTKIPNRRIEQFPHYDLTLSASETMSDADILQHLDNGRRVAVVFDSLYRRRDPLPTEWNGVEVVNGDNHDFRFLDPPGALIGLSFKGSVREFEWAISKGFVRKAA